MKKLNLMILVFILSLVTIGCTTVGNETDDDVASNIEEHNETPTQETHGKDYTILTETSFTGHDGTLNTATLFYNGNIRLSVNNSQTIIASNVGEDFLKNKDSDYPQPSYSLHTLGSPPFIAVVHDFPTVHGPGAKLDLFAYAGQELQTIFSTSDIKLELDAIDYEKGEVTFSLPFANTIVTHVLTGEERAQTEEKLLEFKNNNVKIDDEYIKSIKDGIICKPIEVSFKNTDGIEEILITSNVQSIRTRTPVRIHTNAVFVFEILDNEIQLKDITFDIVKS